MADLVLQPFSFIAEAEGASLGAVVASVDPAAQASNGLAAVRLQCLVVDPELEERAEILACLLQFFLQYLQAHTGVGALLEGVPCACWEVLAVLRAAWQLGRVSAC